MQLEMVTVKHIVTKRLTKNTTSLVFEIDARPGIRYGGELILELRGFLGSFWKGSVGEFHFPSKVKQHFQLDVPTSDGKRYRSFRWIFANGVVFNGNQSYFEGKGKKTSDYKDLR